MRERAHTPRTHARARTHTHTHTRTRVHNAPHKHTHLVGKNIFIRIYVKGMTCSWGMVDRIVHGDSCLQRNTCKMDTTLADRGGWRTVVQSKGSVRMYGPSGSEFLLDVVTGDELLLLLSHGVQNKRPVRCRWMKMPRGQHFFGKVFRVTEDFRPFSLALMSVSP